MKKVLIIIAVFLGLVFLKLFSNTITNEKIIKDYNDKIYDERLINILYIFNFSESYIAYYNNGNIFYKEEKYDKAIEKYKEALKHHPSEENICKIRVNLSLAMIANIDQNKDTMRTKLNEAQEILYEDGCANRNDDQGKNKKAEDLDYEIEKMKNSSDEDDKQDDQQQGDDGNQEEKKYDDIEQKLRENNKNSNQSRQDDINKYDNSGVYEYYSGKRW